MKRSRTIKDFERRVEKARKKRKATGTRRGTAGKFLRERNWDKEAERSPYEGEF